MTRRQPASHRSGAETGGITILVSLMMLVLLTLAAVGMSRNSFREVVISGTARQGVLARNAADSGIEWAIYWQDPGNQLAATGSALSLATEMNTLIQNELLSGVAYDPISQSAYNPKNLPSPPADLTFAAPMPGSTLGLTVGLTRMGKLPITDMSQGVGTGAFTPATGSEVKQASDVWAIRSDSQLTVGSTTFTSAREGWVSTPATN